MSDVELLLVVVALLYGWECACWVGRGGTAFITWFGRTWHEHHPGTVLGNQRGSFIFAPPLPPLGAILTARPLPVSVSPDGLLTFVSTNVNPGFRPGQPGRFLSWDEIREIRSKDKRLLVNGEPWLKFPGAEAARELAGSLSRVLKARPEQRDKEITEIVGGTFDVGAIEKRWELFNQKSQMVHHLTNLIFSHLAFLTPMMIWRFGFKASWLGLLISLFVLTITTAVFFHRAHKALYPKAEDERFTHTLITALSPVTSIRARDALSRPLLEKFHPLAVAKVFLKPERFKEFARPILLDIRHPMLPVCLENKPAVVATESHARAVLLKAAENFLKKAGIALDELCKPPKPADDTCRAYCPRCGAQFTNKDAVCADCGGMPVMEFAPVKSYGLNH